MNHKKTGEYFNFDQTAPSKILLKHEATIQDIWSNITQRAQAHTPTEICRVRNPDPTDFYVNYISKGIPVVIEGLLDSSPAMKKWNEEYLKAMMRGKEVTVCVTPLGVVDEIRDNLLVRPQRTRMLYEAFSDVIFGRREETGVHYVQDTAANLSGEFEAIAGDVGSSMELGKHLSPEPIRNIWIGQAGSHSSLHFDFYENFNCLFAGTKKWTLLHPTDLPFLYLNYWQQAEWVHANSENPSDNPQWRIKSKRGAVRDSERFPWLAVNPDDFDLSRFPRASNCSPLHYLQRKGETLFIPALWHHQVTTGAEPSIAANYWHEPHNPNLATNFIALSLLDRLCRESEALKKAG